MARIDVERRQGGGNGTTGYSGWWWWIVIALIIIGLLIWWGVSSRNVRAGGRQPGTGVQQPTAGQRTPTAAQRPGGTTGTLNLDQVLRANNLPRQFTYGRYTWRAAGVGRYGQQGKQMITIGPKIQGHQLYYEKGTSTKPYKTLYLRANAQGYQDVFVMYKPTNTASKS